MKEWKVYALDSFGHECHFTFWNDPVSAIGQAIANSRIYNTAYYVDYKVDDIWYSYAVCNNDQIF